MDIIKEIDNTVSREDDYWIRFKWPIVVTSQGNDKTHVSDCWLIYGSTFYTNEYSVHTSNYTQDRISGNVIESDVDTKEEALMRLIARTRKMIVSMEWNIHDESIEESLENENFTELSIDGEEMIIVGE